MVGFSKPFKLFRAYTLQAIKATVAKVVESRSIVLEGEEGWREGLRPKGLLAKKRGKGKSCHHLPPLAVKMLLVFFLCLCFSPAVVFSQIVTTLAGSGQLGTGYVDGVGTNAELGYPSSIILDASETNLFFSVDSAIRTIAISSKIVSTLVGSSQGPQDGCSTGVCPAINGVGTSAQMNVNGMTVIGNNLFFTDSRRYIRVVNIVTRTVETFVGNGSAFIADGIGTYSSLQGPANIVADPNGLTLYFFDFSNVMRAVTVSSRSVTTLSFSINADFVFYNGLATWMDVDPATGSLSVFQKSLTSGLVTYKVVKNTACSVSSYSSSGRYFIFADALFFISQIHNNIFSISLTTMVSTSLAGPLYYCALGGVDVGFMDGVGTMALFYYPTSLVGDSLGNIYVLDLYNSAIRLISRFTPGMPCSSNSTCSTNSCMGGYCCNANSIKLGCSACAAASGSCVIYSPGENCTSNFDCSSNLCLNRCCCSSAALVTTGCTACQCLSSSYTTVVTAGQCTAFSSLPSTQTQVQVRATVGPVSPVITTTLIGGPQCGYASAAVDVLGSIVYYVCGMNLKTISTSTKVVSHLAGPIDMTAGYMNGIGTAALFNYPNSLVLFSNKLYLADNFCAIRVVNIPTQLVETLAGTNTAGVVDGIGTSALFNGLSSMTMDSTGATLFIGDLSLGGIGIIRRLDLTSLTVSTLTTSTPLHNVVQGLAVNSLGILYFSTYDGVFKLTVNSGLVVLLKASFTTQAYNFYPGQIALYGDVLYISSGSMYTILAMQTSTGEASLYAGFAWNTFTYSSSWIYYADGVGTLSAFSNINSLSFDGAGNLYVADSGNTAIRVVSVPSHLTSGSPCTTNSSCITGACLGNYCCNSDAIKLGCSACAPASGSCLVYAPGENCTSNFDCSSNLCLNKCCCSSSALVTTGCTACRCLSTPSTTVTTAGLCTIAPAAAVTAATSYVSSSVLTTPSPGLYVTTTLAGYPSFLSGLPLAAADGVGTNAVLKIPNSLAIDASETFLYVTDTSGTAYGDYTIRRVELTTRITTTLAGGGCSGTCTPTNGVGTNAVFCTISGMAVHSNILFVAESSFIRAVDLVSLTVDAFVGSSSSGFVNGIGTMAKFAAYIGSLALDSTDNLYVSDGANSAIRAVLLSTRAVTTLSAIASYSLSFDPISDTLFSFDGSSVTAISKSGTFLSTKTFSLGGTQGNILQHFKLCSIFWVFLRF